MAKVERFKHSNGFKDESLCSEEKIPSYLAVLEHVSNTTAIITLECPIKGRLTNYLTLQKYTNKRNDFFFLIK